MEYKRALAAIIYPASCAPSLTSTRRVLLGPLTQMPCTTVERTSTAVERTSTAVERTITAVLTPQQWLVDCAQNNTSFIYYISKWPLRSFL